MKKINNRKIYRFLFALVAVIALTACDDNAGLEITFDANAFSRANELRVDNRFSDLITMRIEVLAPEQRLIVNITNRSDYKINVGSQSDARIAHPRLQFFDGEVWRRIPRIVSFDPETYRLEERIASGEIRQISIDLERYDIGGIPTESLFRIVLSARGNTSVEGNLTELNFQHEFYAIFAIEERN